MTVEFLPGFFEPPVSPDLVQGEVAYDASSNVSATLPATATLDNLLVAAYFWSSADGTAPTLPSAPTGYTELYSFTALGSNFSLFYKLSDGTETAVTIAAEGALLFWEVAGVNTTEPITSAFATNSVNSTAGIDCPAAGTIAVSPNDALVMGVFGYTDNDHAGSSTSHIGDNDQGDFYMGVRGDGGTGVEDFHIFCSWTEVTDQSTQTVNYAPNETSAENNFASLFVINLDPNTENPTSTTAEIAFINPSSDSSSNVTPDSFEFVFAAANSDSSANVSPEVAEFSFASASSDSSTNASPDVFEIVFSPINEAAVSSTGVTPSVTEAVFTSVNQTAELTVENIVNGIFAHEIDGFSFEEIIRLLLSVAAGDISQQPNGDYSVTKADSTEVRLQGSRAPNNGRNITSINVDP